jgi:PEP-CTERM motif
MNALRKAVGVGTFLGRNCNSQQVFGVRKAVTFETSTYLIPAQEDRPMKCSIPRGLHAIFAVAVYLTTGTTEGFCGLIFDSTSEASQWQVAVKVGGTDGSFSSFPTTGFETATAVTGRYTGTTGWIANNSTGTNAPQYNWTFFVFRQTFDLTGYDPTTADLKFQWAADDSGQGFAGRGTWVPKYSLNGSSLVTGTWPGGNTYSFGPTVDLSSGFVPGLNVIDFYVEGNGVTDGFALNPVSFTASAVPEPDSLTLLGIASASVLGCWCWRRRKPHEISQSTDPVACMILKQRGHLVSNKDIRCRDCFLN